MRSLLTILILCLTVNFSFAQKVKIKKDHVTVDGKKYLNIEKINSSKYFVSTLDGVEFLSIDIESYGTGKYAGSGPSRYEIGHSYSVFKLLGVEDMEESFEIDESNKKTLFKLLYSNKVIVDGKLSIENFKRFKEKYSENVSERRFN